MRRLRVRFTIRWLMLFVAVVSGAFVVTWQRRERAQALALMHAREQARYEDELNPQLVPKPTLFNSAAEPLIFYEEWSQNPYGNRLLFQKPRDSFENLAKARAELTESIRRDNAYRQRMAHHHRQLRRKYERAAARPWESVAPDPAPPQR